MSWLISRALVETCANSRSSPGLVEAFSEASCSDGAPFAPSSVTPTPQAYSAPDRMTEFSRLSRFGMTCELLTADLGEDVLTWFLAGSPVKTSAQPEKAQDSTVSGAASGARWSGSLARYSQDSRLWKTPQYSLLEGLDEFSGTWPRWGTMRDGECWELSTPVLPTSETESGLWPTPRAQDSYERSNWKTIVAANENGTAQMTLTRKIKYESRMWKDSGSPSEYKRNEVPLAAQVGGQLNPTWVEKLMGWPDDWTLLQPISHVKICFWLMGTHNGTETGRSEVLRVLRSGDAAEEIQRAIGRPVSVSEAAVLLAELCEHANRPDEARVFMACAETLGDEVRGVRLYDGTTGAPHRPGKDAQRAGEHPDVMQALSRLLAHHGQAYWQDGRWEDATPRVAHGVAARADRLRAIGNGQVPAVAALAWGMLTTSPKKT